MRIPRSALVAETDEWIRASFAPAVRQIVADHGRMGTTKMAKVLEEEGIDTRTRSQWTPSMVRYYLRRATELGVSLEPA
jgi:hypothetical protein